MGKLEQAVIAQKKAVDDATAKAIARAIDQLAANDPRELRDAALEFYPRLVAGANQAGGAIGLEYFDQLRQDAINQGARAIPGYQGVGVAGGDGVATSMEQVRYHAGVLFDEAGGLSQAGIELFKEGLALSASKSIGDALRDSTYAAVRHDPAKAKYVWIPQGATTCAWCSLHAARMPVVAHEDHAPKSHDHCDCVIKPVWKGIPPLGYNPKPHYKYYREAYEQEYELRAAQGLRGAPDTSAVLARMRRLNPNLSDKVVERL